MHARFSFRFAALLLLASGVSTARADEGMWLFNAPPRAQLRANHGFDADDAWLDHLMKSSVRFGTASASFVSANGLVITNHHVGRSRVQQLSTAERDLMREGFYARTPAEELKVTGVALTVVQSIEDVTARVAAGKNASERRRLVAEIERESRERTGLQSTVVTLFEGGRSHLYRMKRYTDVRLVFAPEFEVAHFGGDVDNFEYPRFCLDVCFFRAYENGRPARTPDFLTWSSAGAREGDLVFVSGHPGNTDRQLTLAQHEYLRDVQLPFSLEGFRRQEVTLKNWAARGAENERRAKRYLLSIENSRKRQDGQLAALQDPQFFARLREAEETLKRELAAAGHTAAVAAFDKIALAQREQAKDFVRHEMLVSGAGFTGQSGVLARNLVRVAGAARANEGGEINPAAAAAETAQAEQAAADPFYDDLEIVRLASSLTRLVERLGAADPLVQRVLAGQSPQARASELTRNSRVRDAAFRREILAGGAKAVAASTDPWLVVMREIAAEQETLRRRRAEQVETIRVASTAIAEAEFQLHGTNTYPDATGTLRLSYGLVRGYPQEGVAAATDFAGLFARAAQHEHRAPFALPARWRERADRIKAATPYNFVATLDTAGGNSGSPIVNRAGEFVGILFDGDLPALSRAFAYDDQRGRSVSVHSAGIEEALKTIYEADALLEELHGKAPRAP